MRCNNKNYRMFGSSKTQTSIRQVFFIYFTDNDKNEPIKKGHDTPINYYEVYNNR